MRVSFFAVKTTSLLLGFLSVPLMSLMGISSVLAQDRVFIDPLFSSNKVISNDVYRPAAPRVGGTTSTLLYDLYRPVELSGGAALPETLPGMLLVHGGGFVQGSKTNSGIVQMAEFFSERGYVVASINYRLINTGNPLLDPAVESGPFPVFPPLDPDEYADWANNPFNFGARSASAANAAHNDTSIFANQFFQDSPELGVDMERIVLGGSSAGAITSLMSGYGDHFNGPNHEFGSVISLAGGLFGLEGLVGADDPALWFQHGTNDTTVPYSNAEALLQRAIDVGLPHSLRTHDKEHSIWEPYFNNQTAQGLTFAEDSAVFLYDQMDLSELSAIPEPLNSGCLGLLALGYLACRRQSKKNVQ